MKPVVFSVVLLLLCSAANAAWKLMARNVCFEPRLNRPGGFKFSQSSSRNYKGVVQVKLVRVSGTIQCAVGHYSSYWGCTHPVVKQVPFNVFVTDHANKVLFPRNRFVHYFHHVAWWYSLPGFTEWSKEIIFSDHANPLKFPGGVNYLRIWSGEDLLNKYEGDNSGKVCVDVYFHYCEC